jgi:hypothetical protein
MNVKPEANVIPLQEVAPLNADEISDAAFRGRDLAWAAAVDAFVQREETEGLTYQALGDRIGKSRSQVHRWLSSPFNMNIGSLGLLAEGLNSDLQIHLVPKCRHDGSTNHSHPSEAARCVWQSRRGSTAAKMHVNLATIKCIGGDNATVDAEEASTRVTFK